MKKSCLSRVEIAKRCAQDVPNGSYVNLGIGMPTLVGSNLCEGKEVMFHGENGIIGIGPEADDANIDGNLLDVSARHVILADGGTIVHHTDSFVIVRGGHLDITIMGALQVSEKGDLANWLTNDPYAIPGIGGSMDLAAGAKNVYIVMEHTTKTGDPKIKKECTFPLTATNCVKTIYTDLAVIDVTERGLILKEKIPTMTVKEVQALTEAELIVDENIKELKIQ